MLHEILHAFGAPDLYTADEYGNNYGLTDELVDYIKNNLDNEIMYTTDRVTGECHYSSITNDLTEITAYYIGWTIKRDCRKVRHAEATPTRAEHNYGAVPAATAWSLS